MMEELFKLDPATDPVTTLFVWLYGFLYMLIVGPGLVRDIGAAAYIGAAAISGGIFLVVIIKISRKSRPRGEEKKADAGDVAELDPEGG